MSTAKQITIVDRNNKQLGVFTVAASDTVEEFKKKLIKECEGIKKRKIGVERIRL